YSGHRQMPFFKVSKVLSVLVTGMQNAIASYQLSLSPSLIILLNLVFFPPVTYIFSLTPDWGNPLRD
ncbi:TPA: hypothetical protein ACRG33_005205, partial [Klebsiella pneumoniae]